MSGAGSERDEVKNLIERAAKFWALRRGRDLHSIEFPDEVIRGGKAVDLLGRDQAGRPVIVLEHTLIESFLDQRSASIAAIKMFEPLERSLQGVLQGPGHFDLSVSPIRVLGLRRQVADIRQWVEAWILRTAPGLAIGGPQTAPRHFATVSVPETSLEVSLYRWPRRDGEFGLVFQAPGPEEDPLAPSLRRALDAKCPKLASAKAASDAESVLLLQIHDIQLGNLFDLDVALAAGLSSLGDHLPDHVWLVDTTDLPPSVLIAKKGPLLGEAIGNRFGPVQLS